MIWKKEKDYAIYGQKYKYLSKGKKWIFLKIHIKLISGSICEGEEEAMKKIFLIVWIFKSYYCIIKMKNWKLPVSSCRHYHCEHFILLLKYLDICIKSIMKCMFNGLEPHLC